ncbi:TetR family transcriptional regulator [Nocardia panacis]|uniref:TetR family transcriptional regulator n=1 Tax=Nocardia panacis TaxID=2340916 RepID=A0A3A4KB08_9NOCA|nr:TetR/AcrR family transcriptional regulator C-terminal domain-containing protein [Nocardia panacis]RJO75235.1 TetR family transcriptional regulator [Nocardia panacis]
MALDRDLIVRTAFVQLDELGLEALSLRKLAKDLAVHPSALYYHFRNKQDLLDEMARALIRPAVRQQDPPASDAWDAWLTHLAHAQRAAMRSRRDGALLMIKARPNADYQVEYLNRLIERLVAQGFSHKDAAAAFIAVSTYTIGAAVAEQQQDALAANSTAGFESIAGASADETFDVGLRWLLSGMRP